MPIQLLKSWIMFSGTIKTSISTKSNTNSHGLCARADAGRKEWHQLAVHCHDTVRGLQKVYKSPGWGHCEECMQIVRGRAARSEVGLAFLTGSQVRRPWASSVVAAAHLSPHLYQGMIMVQCCPSVQCVLLPESYVMSLC